MKKLAALLVLLSVNTYAGSIQEFDEAQEIKCHQELKTLGCVNGEQENKACSEKQKPKLSKECQQLQAAQKMNQ
jgi:hypothetical protein